MQSRHSARFARRAKALGVRTVGARVPTPTGLAVPLPFMASSSGCGHVLPNARMGPFIRSEDWMLRVPCDVPTVVRYGGPKYDATIWPSLRLLFLQDACQCR